MYELYLRPHLDAIFKKLSKKERALFEILQRKIMEILEEPYKFKPLRAPMQGKRRADIGGSYVLVYSIDEAQKCVVLEDYDHHDNVYRDLSPFGR